MSNQTSLAFHVALSTMHAAIVAFGLGALLFLAAVSHAAADVLGPRPLGLVRGNKLSE